MKGKSIFHLKRETKLSTIQAVYKYRQISTSCVGDAWKQLWRGTSEIDEMSEENKSCFRTFSGGGNIRLILTQKGRG